MKGQYFSFDAIIASVIFVLALVALLSYWHSVKSFLDYQNDQLSRDAVRISNMLFTPPDSSNCANIETLGLAVSWDDRRVDSSMLDCIETHDAAWLKGVAGSPYNAYIKVTSLVDGSETEVGDEPPADATDVVNIRRLASVVNTTGDFTYLATIDLSIYK
ncbi:hypothetical protein KKB44_06400 [Candidatus Micrarchaeota archaeon]|nr:hypothetical protein [Candidatus Micrarchaeota archaeon]